VIQQLRNVLSWAGVALTVWGALLLAPDWFGRPDEAWWLVGAGVVLGLGASIATFHLRDAETGVLVGVFGFVGFASLLSGLAIVTAAIVRSVAIRDGGALWTGFACLIIGAGIGIALLGAAIRLLSPPADPRNPSGSGESGA
jgi:hypothetical protein